MSQTFRNIKNEANEPTVICPFDPAHTITRKRLQYHIGKCRKAIMDDPRSPHYKAVQNMEACPYNSLHWIPKEQKLEHMKSCGSIISWTKAGPPSETPSWVNLVDESALNSKCGNDEEDWDAEQEVEGPRHYDPIKQKIESNPTLMYNKQGLTKSKRREVAYSRSKAAAEYRQNGPQGATSQPEYEPRGLQGAEGSSQPARAPDMDGKQLRRPKCASSGKQDPKTEPEIDAVAESMSKAVVTPPSGVAMESPQRVTPVGRGVGRGIGRGVPRAGANRPPPGFAPL